MVRFWPQALASATSYANSRTRKTMNTKTVLVFVGATLVGTLLGVLYIDYKAYNALTAGQ